MRCFVVKMGELAVRIDDIDDPRRDLLQERVEFVVAHCGRGIGVYEQLLAEWNSDTVSAKLRTQAASDPVVEPQAVGGLPPVLDEVTCIDEVTYVEETEVCADEVDVLAGERAVAVSIEEVRVEEVSVEEVSVEEVGVAEAKPPVSRVEQFLDELQLSARSDLKYLQTLRMVWGALLAKIEKEQGFESADWNQATEVYRLILQTTQPVASEDGKREVLRSLPKIISQSRALFDSYRLNAKVKEAILNHLVKIQAQIVIGMAGSDPQQADDVAPVALSDIAPPPHAEELERKSAVTAEAEVEVTLTLPVSLPQTVVSLEQLGSIPTVPKQGLLLDKRELIEHFYAAVSELQVGDRLEFQHHGCKLICELTRVSPVLGKYTFEDRKHHQTMVRAKSELVTDLVQGRAVLLPTSTREPIVQSLQRDGGDLCRQMAG